MPTFSQQPTQQVWLTHYHLSPQEKTSLSRTAHLLCLADNAEDYTQKVNAYLSQAQLNGQAQLAPLPIQTWLARHGFDTVLWRAAQQLSVSSPLRCLYKEEVVSNGQHFDTFLTQRSVRFTPFMDCILSEVLPEAVHSIFFAEFEGLGEYHKILNQTAHQKENEETEKKEKEEKEENQTAKHSPNQMHFYAVVDCAKAVSFPSRLYSAGRLENLYTGNIGQALEEQAPYLLEFDPYQQETVAFLQRLFRKSDSKVFSHWAINPVIFIKSQQPFEVVYRHLRKWTHLYDPNNEKWYFFRFYDPLVLNRYLPQLARYPAQLAALFGVKPNAQNSQGNQDGQGSQDSQSKQDSQSNQANPNSPIIEAFGLRVEEEFVTFNLNPLPDNTLPAKIELGEVERRMSQNLSWQQMKAKLVQEAENYFSEVNSVQLNTWLEEGKAQKIAQTSQGYWFYLCGRIMAVENNWDYVALLTTFQEKTEHSGDELLEAVMKYVMEIAKEDEE